MFDEILNKKLADVEAPPLPPVGTYRMLVDKYEMVERGDTGQVIEFQLKALEAQPDVDEDAMKAFGDVTEVRGRISFWFDKSQGAESNDNKRSHNNLKRFLGEHLQIDKFEKMNTSEALAASANHQCLAAIVHNPDKNDPEIIYANVKKTAPLG